MAGLEGGGGGVAVAQGVATSFANSLCTTFSFGQQPTPGGAVGGANGGVGFTDDGGVQITYITADAPLAPTNVSPASGSQVDTWAQGVTFTGTYNTDASGDTGPLQAVALFISNGISSYWYNGTSFAPYVAGNPIWLLPTTGGGTTNGGGFTLTIPPGVLLDGASYTWTFITQESFVSLSSPDPAPYSNSFASVVAPTAVITAPIGVVSGITPTVSWTGTFAVGTSQTAYRFIVYQSPTLQPGAGTAVYDSLIVTSAATSFVMPSTWDGGLYTPLSGTTYYGYLLLTGTGGNVGSSYASCVFTPQLSGGATPVLSVARVHRANHRYACSLPEHDVR
jgi:hypothetical protein